MNRACFPKEKHTKIHKKGEIHELCVLALSLVFGLPGRLLSVCSFLAFCALSSIFPLASKELRIIHNKLRFMILNSPERAAEEWVFLQEHYF